MSNTFNPDTLIQMFKEGVQDEIRPAIPFAQVAQTDSSNAEFIHYRYSDDIVAENTEDGTYSTTEFEYTDDTIPVTKEAVVSELVKRSEFAKSGGSGGYLVMDRVDRHARAMGVTIHRNTYRTTVDAAGQTLDAEVLAGNASAGTPITMTDQNPDEVSTKVYELLQEVGLSAADGQPYFFSDPSTARQYNLFGMQNGFGTADRTLNGTGWSMFQLADLDYITTPEVERKQVFTFAADPADGDTVTIKGVTFTFAGAPSAAGDVAVGGDRDASLANLAAAINGGAGAGVDYIALSAANRAVLKLVDTRAVVDAANDTVTVGVFGGAIGGAASAATAGAEFKELLAGLRNSTVLRVPSAGMTVVRNDALESDTGTQLRSSQMHDAGVWFKNAPKIVKVRVAA